LLSGLSQGVSKSIQRGLCHQERSALFAFVIQSAAPRGFLLTTLTGAESKDPENVLQHECGIKAFSRSVFIFVLGRIP